MAPPPVVTGISPKEGPPGTRVTIRGEFLGNKAADLIGLTICGSDCLLSAEWKSANKIVARSGPGKGRGDIIVSTTGGGEGTCTVQFRGYYETVGPLKESAVWVEEAPVQNLGWSSRALSSSAFHIEDPLGLSVEGNEKKIPEDDLMELFPGCNGDLSSNNFSPGWFLLENHQATSFDDLRVGLSYLRRKVESQKEGQLSFLKGNVGSVMEQLETLENLKIAFQKDDSTFGTNRTEKLEAAIKACIKESELMFEGVLKGREKADKTRNALGVLTRYKYLLTLPSTIERNLAKGEYDAIISDYARVNNLFGKTDVMLFKKVLAEVDIKVVELKKVLIQRLRTMPNTIDNQKKIIRCLLQLDYKGDPGWEAILEHNKYIKTKLVECQQHYLSKETSLDETVSKSGRSTPKHSRTPSSESMEKNRSDCAATLMQIIGSNLPNMWTLGQSYFSGELQAKPDGSKKEQFKILVGDCIENMCGLSRQLLSVEGSKWPRSPLPLTSLMQCLTQARAAHAVCRSLPALPLPTLNPFNIFISDLRLMCIQVALSNIHDQITKLSSKEEWDLEYTKFGSITQLPKMFDVIISDCVGNVKDVARARGPSETDLFAKDSVKRAIVNKIQNCFSTYVECLENLSINSDEGDRSMAVSQLMATPVRQSSSSHSLALEWEERVVACVSNARYSRELLVKSCCDRLAACLPVGSVVKDTCTQLQEVEARLVATYLEAKCDPLVGTIEPSMYVGHFDWDTQLPPIDLRPYAKEIIANIIAVYAELEVGCSWLKEKVLPQVVESVAEEVSRLVLCVPNMSAEGATQATLDITAIEHALSPYMTDHATGFFNEALESLPPLSQEHKNLVAELLIQFKSRMSMQLSCFAPS